MNSFTKTCLKIIRCRKKLWPKTKRAKQKKNFLGTREDKKKKKKFEVTILGTQQKKGQICPMGHFHKSSDN